MSRIDESRDFIPVGIAVLTVSDTRTPKTDKSGPLLVSMIKEAGHELAEHQRQVGEGGVGCVLVFFIDCLQMPFDVLPGFAFIELIQFDVEDVARKIFHIDAFEPAVDQRVHTVDYRLLAGDRARFGADDQIFAGERVAGDQLSK